MTRLAIILASVAAFGLSSAVFAASDLSVEAALSSGAVGEQADGYLGYAKSVPADVKAKVEAINIKRRAAYADLAAKRGVSVQSAAAATACQTFGRLADGRAYLLPGGGWQVKHGGVKLPDFCG